MKSKNLLVYNIILILCLCYVSLSAQVDNGKDNLKYIDPTIGNAPLLLQPTRPTVHLPNQMVRAFPMRTDYLDDQISSFPLSIVSHRLGEVVSVKPVSGNISIPDWERKLTYDHDLEITRPWYLSTYLVDEDITVEFVPGEKAGYYRFSFSGDGPKNLLFGTYNKSDSKFEILSSNEIRGYETYHENIKVYFYGSFTPVSAAGSVNGNVIDTSRVATGRNAKVWLTFSNSSSDPIDFRYAISFISAEQAKKNFHNEFTGRDFSKMKSSAQGEWAKAIGKIQVSGGTEAQRRTFYSSLYRCYERMVNVTEDGQYYSGFDNKVHESSRPFYVDDWTWDTYLAHHPLRAILDPSMESDIVNSYVEMYLQSGWIPTFPVLFGDHACMNGFHSSIMILDNYRKGIRGFDIQKAYEGMYKNSTQATLLPWKNGPKGPLDDFYHAHGYMPALWPNEKETDTMVHSFEKRQAVAVTLGASYDDWALSQFATDLGKSDDAHTFSLKALNYRNLWDPVAGMFMPKDKDGHWIPIDPKFDGGMGARDYYDENNGWTYLWQVQHDINGLMGLMGGKEKFEKKLDRLFREGLGRSKYSFWAKMPDATGNVGQYSMGNEPSFHIPYLYNFTDAPWKTQKRVRFLLDVWFKDNIWGIPGDEDGGGMTAFVVFSSMGFYPVTPGLPVYTIGSPIFSKVSIKLQNGKTFTLRAKGASPINKYIQSAKLNGVTLNKPWFTHEVLEAGGTLELVMGDKPNKTWGIQP
ncbi:GH92 family glycosyl hydrolase [Olivibacter sitiensis]|uniref:GH92 family glycosyl hydrolase n=1 Tax=Olivibacter sitiensis TaxID=376470 RepID=UPI000487CFBA|nr:GH92 family glycosyl hydrolase [Olivibacter sitiensis]